MDNIHAFPTPYPQVASTGMTLRDYFAGEAMKCQGEICTNPYNNLFSKATVAYKMADAMLKAREP